MSRVARSAIGALLGLIVGIGVGVSTTGTPGYVMRYTVISVALASVLLAVVGAVLCIPRRTRIIAMPAVVVAVVGFAAFYATVVVANHFGAWDEPMVAFGPDIPASLVVLFREDATDQEIYEFVTNVVATPHPRGGSEHLPGMTSLLKVRVGPHDGYAIQLRRDASQQQRDRILSRIRGSRITWKIYEGVAPDKVVLPNAG